MFFVHFIFSLLICFLLNFSSCFALGVYVDHSPDEYIKAAKGLPIGCLKTTCDDGHYFGSASIVKIEDCPPFVLTAAHVLEGAKQVTFFHEGKEYPVRSHTLHPKCKLNLMNKNDLALAFVDGLPDLPNFFTLGTFPEDQEQVLCQVAGFGERGILDKNLRGRYCDTEDELPLCGTLFVKSDLGKVLASEQKKISERESSPLRGDSGGPLFLNDQSLTVIGVAASSYKDLLDFGTPGNGEFAAYRGCSPLLKSTLDFFDRQVSSFCPSYIYHFRKWMISLFRLPQFTARVNVQFQPLDHDWIKDTVRSFYEGGGSVAS